MTSAQLLSFLAGSRIIDGNEIQIGAGDVFTAARFAQTDILTRIKLLEQRSTLVLTSGQRYYSFLSTSITNVVVGNPTVVTAAAHGLNTGDTVAVLGVGGISGINTRWTATRIDANSVSLLGSNLSGSFTTPTALTPARIYHGLCAAFEILSLKRLPPYFGEIRKKTEEEVFAAEERFGQIQSGLNPPTTVDPMEVTRVTETLGGQYLELDFQGTPSATMSVEVRYYRQPLDIEGPSALSDPIIPIQYDPLLLRGTLLYLLEFKGDPDTRKEAEGLFKRWLFDLDEVGQRQSGRARIIRRRPKRLQW
jgi:hypothetical protein